MKKCKVVLVISVNKNLNYKNYPIGITPLHNIVKPEYIFGQMFADIEFRDEKDNVIANTHNDNSGDCFIPNIPQTFIDEFIKSNGAIKEVMIETKIDRSQQKCFHCYEEDKCEEKCSKVNVNSQNEVIIYYEKV